MKLVVPVLAALALVALDYGLLVVLFLFRPTGGEVTAIAMLAGTLVALVLRWRWLFLATQNALSLVMVVRLVQSGGVGGMTEAVGVLVLVLLLALGNLLAWLVVRAVPGRRPT